MSESSNGFFHTKDLTQAAFFYASGVLFLRVDWSNPNQPAQYIFEKPPDEIQSAWQRGDDKVSARAMHDAIRVLSDARYKAKAG